MTTNVYGLPLRSVVLSRRRRLLRAIVGVALLALLCLIYPGVRSLAAQLLGIGTEPAAAAEVTADEPSNVATKKSPAHGADNPLAIDARAAAGLILPKLPSESELVAYVGGEQQFVLGLDNAVSADFRDDVTPASVAPADNGGARSGDRSRMLGGAGAASAGVGSAFDGRSAEPKAAEPQATTAANETAAGDERVATLGRRAVEDLASTVAAESRIEAAGSNPSGDGSTNGDAAVSGAGSAASPAVGTTATFADSVPADIAPGVMVLAEIAGREPEPGSSGAGAPSVAAGVAADVPGVVADVPEPAMLLLLGIGLASVAYRIRSRA